MYPTILITTAAVKLNDVVGPEFVGVRRGYSDAVSAAGGLPLQVPQNIPVSSVRKLLAKCDGLILSGGEDVNPELYGEDFVHPKTRFNRRRDELEVAMIKYAILLGMPILGICRGMQLLAVVNGGTLHQSVKEAFGKNHQRLGKDRWTKAVHTLTLNSGSKLRKILGPTVIANSLHDQCINTLGGHDPYEIVAFSPEGVPEAMELRHKTDFRVGIQCHPEAIFDSTEPKWLNLFKAHVDTARKYSRSKK